MLELHLNVYLAPNSNYNLVLIMNIVRRPSAFEVRFTDIYMFPKVTIRLPLPGPLVVKNIASTKINQRPNRECITCEESKNTIPMKEIRIIHNIATHNRVTRNPLSFHNRAALNFYKTK